MLKMRATCSFPTITIGGKFQEKEVTPSKEVQRINADAGYTGLNEVVVNAIPDNYIEPTGTENITANGTYDITTKASVNVNVSSEEINLQEKSISVATNGSVEVTADSGYTGLSKVNVSNTQELEQISVTPTTEIQTITPTGNKLINQVNVSAIPSEYIIPSGTQSITSNGTYDITSKASVEVNVPGEEVVLQSKNVTPTTEIQNITADDGYDGLSSVSISAVDSSIDSNIVAENIKKGVNILGVVGNLASSSNINIETQSYTPTENEHRHNFTHNLGVIPDMILIYAASNRTSSYGLKFAFGLNSNALKITENSLYIRQFYGASSASEDYNSIIANGYCIRNANSSSFNFEHQQFYLQANIEYYIVLISGLN